MNGPALGECGELPADVAGARDHPDPFSHEGLGYRQTNAFAGTGHHRELALQHEIHHQPLSVNSQSKACTRHRHGRKMVKSLSAEEDAPPHRQDERPGLRAPRTIRP